MANFDKAAYILKGKEGGYSTNKNDKGNYYKGEFVGTMHGISAPVLAGWYGRDITVSDMKSLPYATALKIYKRDYWNLIDGDKINNQSIANLIFDGAVNHGVGGMKTAFKNYFGVTYSADYVNNYKNEKQLFDKIQQARINRYDLIKSDPSYDAWIDRVKSYVFTASEVGVKSFKKMWLPLLGIGIGVAALVTVLVITTTKNK